MGAAAPNSHLSLSPFGFPFQNNLPLARLGMAWASRCLSQQSELVILLGLVSSSAEGSLFLSPLWDLLLGGGVLVPGISAMPQVASLGPSR